MTEAHDLAIFYQHKNLYTYLAVGNISGKGKVELLQRQPLVSSSEQSVNLLSHHSTTCYNSSTLKKAGELGKEQDTLGQILLNSLNHWLQKVELSEFHLCFRKQNPSIYLSSFKKPPNTETTNEFSVLQKPNWEIYTEPVSMMHYSLLLHICHIQHLEKSWVIARSPKCLSPISSGQNAQGGMGRGKFLHLPFRGCSSNLPYYSMDGVISPGHLLSYVRPPSQLQHRKQEGHVLLLHLQLIFPRNTEDRCSFRPEFLP